MATTALCVYTLSPHREAEKRGFVQSWGRERAYAFWEGLHRDLLREAGVETPWELVVMTSGGESVRELERLAPTGTVVEEAPGLPIDLDAAFARLAGRYERVVIAAADLPGLTRERVSALFTALEEGAEVAFLRERKNRFSVMGMASYRPELLAFNYGGGRFWEYLTWLEERGVRVYWEEERLDDLPAPDWVLPVLGFAVRPLLPSMAAWPVDLASQPELVLVGRIPSPENVTTALAEELAALPGVGERGRSLAASFYRAILFDRMDSHRGQPGYRCVGAFPLDECARRELIGFPEVVHPLSEAGPVEAWLRDVLCDLDPAVPRVVCASDVPCLPEELLERIFRTLAGTDVVLAPAGDGDYNLVGMSRFHEIFGPRCFESGHALAEVKERLRRRHVGLCVFSEVLRDLGRLEDLRWLGENLTMAEAPRLYRRLRETAGEIS